MINALKGKIIDATIKNFSKSEPRTTLAGFVVAGVVASNVDWSLILNKDPSEIGKVVAALAVAVMGYYTNHADLVKPKVGSTQETGEKMPPKDSLN